MREVEEGEKAGERVVVIIIIREEWRILER